MTGVSVSVHGRDFFAAQRRLRQQSALLIVGLFLLLWLLTNLLSGVHTTKVCETEHACETVWDLNVPALIIITVSVAAYLVIGPWATSRYLITAPGARVLDGLDGAAYRNVVEEMAIASGAPIPHALVVDDPALNAYAVSDGRRQGAVIVTTGLLAALDRRELGGVVAHEIAHLRNRDSRVMLVTVYAVGAIIVAALTAIAFTKITFEAFERTRGRLSFFLVGMLLVIFGALAALLRFIAVPAGLLMRAALSRQREELADASAVQYTRDPTGLRTALEKIARANHTPRLPLLARALCIAEPRVASAKPRLIEKWMTLYPSTSIARWTHEHPPIDQRIAWLRALEGASGSDATTPGVDPPRPRPDMR